MSDHCIIHTILNIPKENLIQKTVTYRKYSNIDHAAFCKDLQFDIAHINDVNFLVSQYEEKARAAIDHHAPEKTKTITMRPCKTWFTSEVKQQKTIMRKQERVWRRSKSQHDWKLLIQERKQYRSLLKKTKTEILSSKVLECKGNTKMLYQLFKNISGQKTENPMPQSQSDQQLADDFADYFMTKIDTIRNALQHVPAYTPEGAVGCNMSNFHPIEEHQVQKIIMSLSTKSCELDIVPTRLLKEILPSVLPIITKIVNLSLEKGVFAEAWKTAIIRPQIKKIGLELTSANYRPVSNLSFLSKVLEKAALQQFMQYSDVNGLMPDYQSAYRPNFSCETALVKLMNDLLWSMENQEVTALMAIDLSAAFDTVDHNVLLSVLNVKFGIEGAVLSWFDTYLRPRCCQVIINSVFSETKNLSYSVPQGSCAGPVLYLAYASTMQEVIPRGVDLHGYADDHAMKISFKAKDRLEEERAICQLEKCAIDIKTWMDRNRLKMNSSKTEFILFGSSKHLDKCSTLNINVNDENVDLTKEIKYLGVHLDCHLTLKHHIT